MKHNVKTRYYNPILKDWEDELSTPYLKKGFTNWSEYATMVGPHKGVKVQK